MFKTGRGHYKHEKLQVRKVTGRNSINIEDIQILDKEIVADVRDYKYNHKLAFSLLGNDSTHKQTLLAENDKLNREVCKRCWRSTRALNQEPKSLCSLGCALESVFGMTLQEIHEAQLGLSKGKNGTNAPHVLPRDSRIATTTTKGSEANKTEVIEHLRIVPDTIKTSRNALHTTSDTFDNSRGKHKGKEVVEEEEDASVVSLMVDNNDEVLQSGCVNRSLHVPRDSRIATTTTKGSEANKTEVIEHLRIVPDTIKTSRNALHTTSDTFDNSRGKHKGKEVVVEEEEEEDASAVSLMVDNKDEILQSGCVNRSLHVPLRTKEDLRRYFETYVSQLSFKDMNLKPPSIQVRSTPTTTPELEFPNGIKRTNKGTRQREDARTPPKKMARIMKAPCSVSRKVSIDTDMFHNLCLLAYGESLVYQTEENVENDAPSS